MNAHRHGGLANRLQWGGKMKSSGLKTSAGRWPARFTAFRPCDLNSVPQTQLGMPSTRFAAPHSLNL